MCHPFMMHDTLSKPDQRPIINCSDDLCLQIVFQYLRNYFKFMNLIIYAVTMLRSYVVQT